MKPSVFRPFPPVFRGLFDDFFKPASGYNDTGDFLTMPAVNVKQENGAYHLEVAAPGLNKEDFHVSVENGVLTVSAEKQKSAEDKTDHYTRREFHYASFKRSFQLPDGVKEADIKATYKDGVLNLELPPVEEKKLEKGRTIEIQ